MHIIGKWRLLKISRQFNLFVYYSVYRCHFKLATIANARDCANVPHTVRFTMQFVQVVSLVFEPLLFLVKTFVDLLP